MEILRIKQDEKNEDHYDASDLYKRYEVTRAGGAGEYMLTNNSTLRWIRESMLAGFSSTLSRISPLCLDTHKHVSQVLCG